MTTPGTNQLTLPLLADVTSRGDGTYLLKPRIVSGTVDQWITPKEAAVLLGFRGPEGRSSVYRLCERGMVQSRRPSPRKILISLESVQKHCKASADPEFWDRSERKP